VTQWRGPLLAMALTTAVTGAGAIWAIPGLLMSVAIDRLASAGGVNSMSHGSLATPARQPVVRPSPDLAYSACPFDLNQGPLLIEISPVAGRYSSLSIFDGRTDVIFVRNDVQAKGQPYRLVVALHGQPTPAGTEVVRSDTASGIALVRLLLTAPSELPQVQAGREKSSCRTIAVIAAK
jgi:uncharacterized membrane protein